MRNIIAISTIVIVLMGLVAFVGCSKQVSNTKSTLADDIVTGNFAASRVPRSGYFLPAPRTDDRGDSSLTAGEQCAKECAWKFDSCRTQRRLESCRAEYNTCYNAC
ncbi:hypothetical protein HYS47_04140 [Candidatus Woesearchaeota archaeon]|nr:hypothetical protein [Candidatus Woesearchaeota archaeon]